MFKKFIVAGVAALTALTAPALGWFGGCGFGFGGFGCGFGGFGLGFPFLGLGFGFPFFSPFFSPFCW